MIGDTGIDARGVDRLNRELSSLARGLKDISTPLKGTGNYLAMAIDDRFKAGGPGWAPLAPSTRARKFRAGVILVDTGYMRKTIGPARVDRDSVTIAPSAYYAKYHHRPDAKGAMIREFMLIDEQQDEPKIIDLFVRQQDREVAKAAKKIKGRG